MRLGSDVATLGAQLAMPPEVLAALAGEVTAATTQALAVATDPVNQMSLYEVDTYLKDTLLRDVDVVSMHSGLEVRPVFLDTPLVELALSFPGNCKIRDHRRKAVIADAFPDILPPHVVTRPKRGFHLPALEWTPTICRDRWRDTFESPAARAWLTPPFRQQALSAGADRQTAKQPEWAAFVLFEVIRRCGLDV
jgi:asparagine synthetase B (glutamine-hydrolysing)